METDKSSTDRPAPAYTLRELVLYALRLGALGFGGPVALVGYMRRDLVEQRRWISEADYKEGLTLAQLMPGPLAAQLAIYLGFVHYAILGATLVGVAFVLPSFLMVVALGAAYLAYGGLAWMQSVFYGVGAAVIGIIALSAYKLTAKSIGRDRLLWAIYLAAAVVTVLTESETVLLFLGAGVLVWLLRAPPKGLFPGAAGAALAAQLPTAGVVHWPLLAQIGAFFAEAGAFVFGSGLAIVPFLYGGLVTGHHWLTERQFIDAVAVAMITPGPVVITVGFIGYLIAGLPGAVVAAFATFLPCYLLTIIPAPYFRKHGKRPGIVAFVDGVTAAAIGAITGAVIVLGKRSIVDLPTVAIMAVAVLALWKFRKLPEPLVVAVAAAAGLALHPAYARGANDAALELAASIPLPTVAGRIDHMADDARHGRLLVAALGNGTLEVLDLASGRDLRSIPGFGAPQGVAFAPEADRVYVANGDAHRVDVLDARTFAPLMRIGGLPDADNLRYDAATRTVLVGYGGGALRVLDADSGKSEGDVALAGHPEAFELDPDGRRAYVNVPDAREIAVVDRAQRRVVAAWHTPGARANFPMALDAVRQRLFVGARAPAVMLVYDTASGRVVTRVAIGRDADEIFFDARRRRVYVVCGEGRVDVFRQETPDRYGREAAIATAPHARTGLFVPERRTLYVAAPSGAASGARVLVFRAR